MSSGYSARNNTSVFKDPSDGLYKTRIDGEIDVTADIESSTTPAIYNVSAPVAGTEYSQVLTDGTKKIFVSSRDRKATVQFSFVSSTTGTNYITIPAGASYNEEGLNLTGVTIYFQTDKASQTIEIKEWT